MEETNGAHLTRYLLLNKRVISKFPHFLIIDSHFKVSFIFEQVSSSLSQFWSTWAFSNHLWVKFQRDGSHVWRPCFFYNVDFVRGSFSSFQIGREAGLLFLLFFVRFLLTPNYICILHKQYCWKEGGKNLNQGSSDRIILKFNN